jgi:hypothetical protein
MSLLEASNDELPRTKGERTKDKEASLGGFAGDGGGGDAVGSRQRRRKQERERVRW